MEMLQIFVFQSQAFNNIEEVLAFIRVVEEH